MSGLLDSCFLKPHEQPLLFIFTSTYCLSNTRVAQQALPTTFMDSHLTTPKLSTFLSQTSSKDLCISSWFSSHISAGFLTAMTKYQTERASDKVVCSLSWFIGLKVQSHELQLWQQEHEAWIAPLSDQEARNSGRNQHQPKPSSMALEVLQPLNTAGPYGDQVFKHMSP